MPDVSASPYRSGRGRYAEGLQHTMLNALEYGSTVESGVLAIQSRARGTTINNSEPLGIYIPPGRHVLRSPIRITRHSVSLYVDGGAILVPASNQACIYFDGSATTETYLKHWTLWMMGQIYGNASGTSQHGVIFKAAIHGTGFLNEVRSLGGSGLVFDGATFSNHITFNRVAGVAGWGIHSTGVSNHNANIVVGEVQFCGLGGANFRRWTTSDITLRVENMSGGVPGIKLDGARSISLGVYFEVPSNSTGDDIVTAATDTACTDIVLRASTKFSDQKTGSAYNINLANSTVNRLTIQACSIDDATTRILNVGSGNTRIVLQPAVNIPTAAITNSAGLEFSVTPPRPAVIVLAQSAVQVTAPADTSFNALATVTVPGGAMGPNGRAEVYAVWGCTNNGNAKVAGVRLTSASGTIVVQNTITSSASCTQIGSIANRNSASSQVMGTPNADGGIGVTATPANTDTVNTDSDWTIRFMAQKATAGDTVTLESYRVLLYPGA